MRFDKPRARFSHYNMGLSGLERPCRAASQRVALADDRVGQLTLLTFGLCDAPLRARRGILGDRPRSFSRENGEGATARSRY